MTDIETSVAQAHKRTRLIRGEEYDWAIGELHGDIELLKRQIAELEALL